MVQLRAAGSNKLEAALLCLLSAVFVHPRTAVPTAMIAVTPKLR